MAKQEKDLREVLRSYKYDFDLIQKVSCTKEENAEYTARVKAGQALPENVYRYQYETGEESFEFYRIHEPELTEQEIAEYLTYKQLKLLNTIKNCVVFFTVLTVISMVIGFFAMIA